jgi:DNA repair protein RadA/Sms
LKATEITCTAFCVPLKSIWFHSRNWHLRNVRSGLREVSNPSEILISHKDEELWDCHLYLEGMRPLMIEIQSSQRVYGTPQRSRRNAKRLNMILAVLEKGPVSGLAKDVFST